MSIVEFYDSKGRGPIIVSAEDYDAIKGYSWSAYKDKNTSYARCSFFLKGQKRQRTLLLHRVICDPAPGLVVDHIDGNGLNNTRANLRVTTQANNMRNSAKYKASSGRLRCSSEYKGVHKVRDKWRARIMIAPKKRINLGYFLSEIDAARAYNKAAQELFGEFAKLNEVD